MTYNVFFGLISHFITVFSLMYFNILVNEMLDDVENILDEKKSK